MNYVVSTVSPITTNGVNDLASVTDHERTISNKEIVARIKKQSDITVANTHYVTAEEMAARMGIKNGEKNTQTFQQQEDKRLAVKPPPLVAGSVTLSETAKLLDKSQRSQPPPAEEKPAEPQTYSADEMYKRLVAQGLIKPKTL
jgi:hypothetical protein